MEETISILVVDDDIEIADLVEIYYFVQRRI